MKDVLSAPFMVEMIRTTTNMYAHGWDERNGGNISLLLDKSEAEEYLDTEKVLRTYETGFSAPSRVSIFWSPAPASISKTYSTRRT